MNNHLPLQSKILSVKKQTPDTKTIRLKVSNFNFTPGQFVMAGIFGFGEAPFSISSSPSEKGYIDLTIRSVGNLSKTIFNQNIGNYLAIRGPFGNGFPIYKFKQSNIIIVSGGCGLAPMHSIINYARDHKNYFRNMQIIYGTKTPEDILFNNEINSWKKFAEVMITVDLPNKSWAGNTGLVTNLITDKTIGVDNSYTIMCGPPVMYHAVAEKLNNLGFSYDKIYVSLERNMQCGQGLCQHCTCGEKYVCTDGPVFTYNQLKYQSYKKD